MKKYLFPILSLLRPIIPLKLLISISGERIILPLYHAIADQVPPHLENLYKIKTVRQFEQDLEFLLRHFQPWSLEDLLKGRDNKGKPVFHLSFDDGLREVYDLIEPILSRKGIPASFFINPDFVDNAGLFYRYKASTLIHFASSFHKDSWKEFHAYCRDKNVTGRTIKEVCLAIKYKDKIKLDEIAEIMGFSFDSYLKEFRPYMEYEQLKTLEKKGFTLGAHSLDHPEYKNLSGKEMLYQTLQSTAWLKEKFNQPHSVFAFPFSDEGVGKEFFHSLGYDSEPLIDMSFGTAGIKKEQTLIHKQRIPMEVNKLSAKSVIFSEYLYYLLKLPFGKNTIYR